MRTILFILQKEFIQIFRNKAMLPIIFMLPIVQLLILANAATQIAGKTVSEVKAELIRLLTTGDRSEDETEKEY